jgi:hypothetical protein
VPLSAVLPLAPAPDFRYVGLDPGPRIHVSTWASFAGAGMTLAAGLVHELGLRGVVLGAAGAAVAAFALRRRAGPKVPSMRGDPVPMAIVPWGILVDPDATNPVRDPDSRHGSRVLRWAGVKRVHVDMVHGQDQGTATTLWSVVTIETEHERLAGRAPGAVGIERLLAHLDAYAEEQAHEVALDLDGAMAAEGPFEPVIEPLLGAARAMASRGGSWATRLGLAAEGYRRAKARATDETIALLRGVLRDRVPRSPDPRAFAAVLAAELRADAVANDLLPLVQSPHPVLAAVAKVAASKLGIDVVKVGAVSEVAPFLDDRDVEALSSWMEVA